MCVCVCERYFTPKHINVPNDILRLTAVSL